MPTRPTIRPATEVDAAAIADIYNASIAARDATMDASPKSAADIRAYMAAFSEREGYLVLEAEGTVLGWGIVKRYSDREGYRYCAETSVYLRRDQLRKGYGKQLQRALLDFCREKGYHHILVRIWASNAASIAFHRREGFEMVGIQREIGFMNGQWQDVAIMQCILADVLPPEVP